MSHRARVETARARALAVIDELEQLTPERRPQLDAARRLVIEATASPTAVAKASSELRHVLEQLRAIEKQAPADPDTDPIEAIRLRALTPTTRKRASK